MEIPQILTYLTEKKMVRHRSLYGFMRESRRTDDSLSSFQHVDTNFSNWLIACMATCFGQ